MIGSCLRTARRRADRRQDRSAAEKSPQRSKILRISQEDAPAHVTSWFFRLVPARWQTTTSLLMTQLDGSSCKTICLILQTPCLFLQISPDAGSGPRLLGRSLQCGKSVGTALREKRLLANEFVLRRVVAQCKNPSSVSPAKSQRFRQPL